MALPRGRHLNLSIQLEKVNLTLFKFSQDASACATHNSVPLSPISTDLLLANIVPTLQHCWPTTPSIATLLANNSQHWNIVGQQLPTLLGVTCCVRCTPSICMLLRVVGSCCTKTFPLFRDRRSVSQQPWIRLHISSNIAGAMHARYIWSPW